MRLLMTLVVRNEADIVGANIEYHLAQGVDFVLVTDHGSDDGTPEILAEYEQRGAVRVIRDDRAGHHQSERVTRMVEIARREHGADWIINNDADEFWWPHAGSLRDVFGALAPEHGQIVVERRNFRPRPDGAEPFYSRLVHREVSSLGVFGHALGPKVAHRPAAGVVVAPGNHAIRGVELALAPHGELLEIFHFPMREYEQFERKVVQTGVGYERVGDRSPSVGRDQLELLALHRAGRLREYYDGFVLDDRALERGLRTGAVVVDRRLEHFMRALHAGEHSAVTADAPFAAKLLRRVVEDAVERGRLSAEAGRLRGARERLVGEVAQRERTAEQLAAELKRVASERDEANLALDRLRSSRLVRSTSRLRRLYYRVSGRAPSS